MNRKSEEYQDLLDKAYNSMYMSCDSFRRALSAAKGAVLKHSIGKTDKKETVLTISKFCGRLTRLRDYGKC